MPLTEHERTKVYEHLGYTVLSTPTTLGLGYPLVTQARFILDQNLLNLTPAGEEAVRKMIGRLECYQQKEDDLVDTVEVAGVGSTRFRTGDALDDLDIRYKRAQQRLADLCAAQINPLSQRDGPRGVIEPC